MTLTGRQKAAMLLMSLDAVTAAELLKGIDEETVQDIAVELAYLDASGLSNSGHGVEVVHQFCSQLKQEKKGQFEGFLSTMLASSVGSAKAEHIQTQIGELLQKRDPFMSIREVETEKLASVLQSQHPQAIAVTLSELATKKSSEVLALLDEGVRLSAVTRLTSAGSVTAEAKNRIAQMICESLETVTETDDETGGETSGEAVVAPQKSLRKVAIILRNLTKEIRDGLLKSIADKDSEAGEKVTELMVLWEDLPQIEDRSLQDALREIDSLQLALALIDAEAVFEQKIKSNISERAAETIDEETSLMSSPKKEDIQQAKDDIVEVLRTMNNKGELNFVEE